MTPFMRARDRIRKYIQTYDLWVSRILHGLIMLVSLLVIASAFPFAQGLNRPVTFIALGALGVFMPLSAVAIIIMLFLLINLFSLSQEVAGAVLIMILVSYMLCLVYRSKKVHHIAGMTVARQLGIPFVIPVQSALLGNANEVVTIICGSVISFFLQEIHNNFGVLKPGEGQVNIVDFLSEKLIANQLFYIYLLAMLALFLITYSLRIRSIEHSWTIGVLTGCAVEFLIMLSGYLMIGPRTSIPTLIVANIATIAIGLGTVFLYQDLDYSRVEYVRFEDDEYYYYVTAVPKIRLAEEQKEVKRISVWHRKERRTDES